MIGTGTETVEDVYEDSTGSRLMDSHKERVSKYNWHESKGWQDFAPSNYEHHIQIHKVNSTMNRTFYDTTSNGFITPKSTQTYKSDGSKEVLTPRKQLPG